MRAKSASVASLPHDANAPPLLSIPLHLRCVYKVSVGQDAYRWRNITDACSYVDLYISTLLVANGE